MKIGSVRCSSESGVHEPAMKAHWPRSPAEIASGPRPGRGCLVTIQVTATAAMQMLPTSVIQPRTVAFRIHTFNQCLDCSDRLFCGAVLSVARAGWKLASRLTAQYGSAAPAE